MLLEDEDIITMIPSIGARRKLIVKKKALLEEEKVNVCGVLSSEKVRHNYFRLIMEEQALRPQLTRII